MPFLGMWYFSFSALSLLVGDRRGIRPVKSWALVCWWWWFDWTSYSSRCHHHFYHFPSIKPAKPGSPGKKWPIIGERETETEFKIAPLTFKSLSSGNPPYLASLLHRHTPYRTLRSVSANLLSVTRCNLSFGIRGFLPSGIVSQLTSVLVQLSEHVVDI